MKLDKDFKTETRRGFAEGNYILRRIAVVILVIIVLASLLGVGLKLFNTNADRVIFKQSVTYNEGVVDDLASYKLEMIRSEDEFEKKAIAEMVNSRFANYDESKIENYDLREFLQDCRNLRLEEY